MFPIILLGGAALLAAGDVGQKADRPELETYRALRSEAKDADGHVRLALWCEAHGLSAERIKHLAAAVLTDPGHAAARGLMGLVAFGGRWSRPEQLAARVKADEALTARLAAYNARRARTGESADAQWKLALWCQEQGLEPEAQAHLSAVVRLDPGREAAWKRLGYRKHKGRWMTDAQVAAEKADREAQARADKTWGPKLESWRRIYRKPQTRRQGEALLATVNDPRAVGAVWRTFTGAEGDDDDLTMAVQILGRLDTPGSSRGLAVLSVAAASPEVRRKAAETLKRRDPRDFLGGLIALFGKPTRFFAKPVGVDGVGSPGFLAVEGPDAVYQTVFTVDESLGISLPPAPGTLVPPLTVTPTPSAPPSAAGSPQVAAILNNARRSGGTPLLSSAGVEAAARAELDYMMRVGQQNQNIARGAQTLAARNAEIRAWNDAAGQALYQITGQDFGPNPKAWLKWWADQQGLVYETAEPPTVDEYETVGPKPVVTVDWVHVSCFAAGTPVLTIDGSKPIERVQVGDRLLAQDVRTGRVELQPVVAVHHNPPSATLRLDLGGETVVATGIHRFWKAGTGWVMARDLKIGDRVRTVGGLATVGAVEPDATQPVFNLEVAHDRTFFVGKTGALVHDNSLVAPAFTPFDAVPEISPAGHLR
jgi:hypothetical protein